MIKQKSMVCYWGGNYYAHKIPPSDYTVNEPLEISRIPSCPLVTISFDRSDPQQERSLKIAIDAEKFLHEAFKFYQVLKKYNKDGYLEVLLKEFPSDLLMRLLE